MRLTILLSLLFSLGGNTAPSLRRLPPGAPAENNSFFILRDHQRKDLLYGLPKFLEVTESSLSAFGKQEHGCNAVEQYLETQARLGNTRLKLAKISEDRASIISTAVEYERMLREDVTALKTQKKNLQSLAESEVGKPAHAEISAKVAELEADIAQTEKSIASLEKLATLAKNEQTDLLSRVQELNLELQEFEPQITRLAARVTIKLKLPALPGGSFEFPKLSSLSLFPAGQEEFDGSFKAKSRAKAAGLGDFPPEWSEKPFKLSTERLLLETDEEALDLMEFPRDLFFEQMLSLRSYCELKDKWNAKNEVNFPLRVGYSVPVWKDDGVSQGVALPAVSHKVRLPKEVWESISQLPVAEKSELDAEDVGAPEKFNVKGRFVSRSLNLELKLTEKGENK